jgi:hypothetical protein
VNELRNTKWNFSQTLIRMMSEKKTKKKKMKARTYNAGKAQNENFLIPFASSSCISCTLLAKLDLGSSVFCFKENDKEDEELEAKERIVARFDHKLKLTERR